MIGDSVGRMKKYSNEEKSLRWIDWRNSQTNRRALGRTVSQMDSEVSTSVHPVHQDREHGHRNRNRSQMPSTLGDRKCQGRPVDQRLRAMPSPEIRKTWLHSSAVSTRNIEHCPNLKMPSPTCMTTTCSPVIGVTTNRAGPKESVRFLHHWLKVLIQNF